MDSTGAGIRAGLDVIVIAMVCVEYYSLCWRWSPKDKDTLSAKQKKKTWPDGGKANINLAGKRRSRRRWSCGGRGVTGRLTNI